MTFGFNISQLECLECWELLVSHHAELHCHAPSLPA